MLAVLVYPLPGQQIQTIQLSSQVILIGEQIFAVRSLSLDRGVLDYSVMCYINASDKNSVEPKSFHPARTEVPDIETIKGQTLDIT